tara:strand:+ start:8507 stop:8842 length:336 start_codon:yes stop_codon:yes gene_type:complete
MIYNLRPQSKAQLEELQSSLKRLSKESLHFLINQELRARIDSVRKSESNADEKIGAINQLMDITDFFNGSLMNELNQMIGKYDVHEESDTATKTLEKAKKQEEFKARVLKK